LRPAAALLDRAGDSALLAETTETAHRLADALPEQTWLLRFRGAPPVRRFFAGARPPAPAGERARRAAPAYPDHLSEREVEVLRLVAAGRSNQQIAGELVISPSTVSKHVTSVLSKTGSANRAQATAYAKDHGLA
jgi:DNA-binding NarL/FixJ family response regulator